MSLLDEYLKEKPVEQQSQGAVTPLLDSYLNEQEPVKAAPITKMREPERGNNAFKEAATTIGKSVLQGGNDVLNAVGGGIGFIDKQISNEGAIRNENFQKYIANENSEFEKNYKDNPLAEGGRLAGQILATGPLVPAKAIQATFRAMPTVLATGEKIAAPLINRFGSSVAAGGVGGAEFGALTSTSNDKSLGENVAIGSATGALGGPLANAAVAAGRAVPKILSSSWRNYVASNAIKESGLGVDVAKNIIARLDDAGFTPETAKVALQKLGPNATLADLDHALTTEASGLASRGGKETSILKNTFSTRADTANNEAVKIMEGRLGPKPDLKAEGEKIVNQARKLTHADYEIAKKSKTPLNSSGIISDIDTQLNSAVGSEASALRNIKSYFYDPIGNVKSSVKDLHKVRQGLDDLLDKLPSEGTSQTSHAYRAVENVRKAVDTELKIVPEMAAADAKFAEKMKIKSGLDIGSEALKKGSFDDFKRQWDVATPEIKETIKKGLRSYIGDLMDAAQRGELAGAQRLFAKNSKNQKIIKEAFGSNGEEVLMALQKEAAFRGTERAITSGSQTAERLAVRERYEGGSASGGFIRDAFKAGALDLATGSSGVATGMNIVRSVGSGAKTHFNILSSDNLAQGSADLLSRQGVMRDSALDVLGTVNKIYKKSSNTKFKDDITNKLPTIGAPIGLTVYGGWDKLNQRSK